MSPWPLTSKGADRVPRLVCTVSTVKDSTANVIRFVERNLAAGVDHMFIFLEGETEEVQTTSHALRDQGEHVTLMRVGPRYWHPNRPPGLNGRKITHAGFVNCVLAPFPAVQWLFHIDGDECLDIDRHHLLTLPPDVPIVRLQTHEVVSKAVPDGEVDVFKRQLDLEDLCLLTVLGIISAPANGRYFNGHTSGKPGLRPNLDLRVRNHGILDRNDGKLEHYQAESLHVLHYESFSGEEFVRKWLAHLSSGATPKFSGEKDQLRAAIAAILRNPVLTEERKQELLHEVYRRRVEDDASTLNGLGLLVRPNIANHSHSPQAFDPQDAHAVRQLIELLRRCDKRGFRYGNDGPQPVQLLRDARAQLEAGTHLAERIDQCIAARERESTTTATRVPSHPPSADPADAEALDERTTE